MVKLAWLTDIHLNFLDREEKLKFYNKIKILQIDCLLITGDIAEAPIIVDILDEMILNIGKKIYFIAGNHDYYNGSVNEVKNKLFALTKNNSKLHWLSAIGPVILSEGVVLIGQDGWADGRYGDYNNTKVCINDNKLILDLFQQKILGKFKLLDKMQQLAGVDADCLLENLELAITMNAKKIIILTHVPPFAEACLYNNVVASDDWLPFFSSKIMGDIIYKLAKEHRNIKLLVLCGHTHQYADVEILSNLRVKVGKAEYYKPEVQEVFSV